MSAQQIVFGFIELSPQWLEQDRKTLLEWNFDEGYPFPDIFCLHGRGYQSAMVSYAGSFKTLEDDWGEWLSRFEELLMALNARTAAVRLDDEHDGTLYALTYLCEAGWTDHPRGGEWQKWRTVDGKQIAEKMCK